MVNSVRLVSMLLGLSLKTPYDEHIARRDTCPGLLAVSKVEFLAGATCSQSAFQSVIVSISARLDQSVF